MELDCRLPSHESCARRTIHGAAVSNQTKIPRRGSPNAARNGVNVTTEQKLNAHLEHIVMPEGVPLSASQVLALCDQADYAQRMAAIDRARTRNPFLLPDEEREAQRWAELGRQSSCENRCV
jgi:hypothetical protein